ncbi:ketoacyl-synt-domain-containing protein [Xylariaceae sp. AK1471]|nr:ketoacyl-synt-domain-containing protein [Xylariaceae sp. AK1471]
MESDRTMPIAVIGMSFQLPGGATSPESLWSMMLERRCASTDFPVNRLGGSAFHHPDRTRGDSVPLKGGHFIQQEIGAFDAPFFSISASEAEGMDPQSRSLLETTYRALENAGESIESVSNSKTSVYTGNLAYDYQSVFEQDIEQNSKYGLVGWTGFLSGRLSWFFNLKGPNLTLDTACSSSLVALDLGCQSLLASSADMAIVTGCSLLFSPHLFHHLSNMGMLSPDSKSFSFDHRANGYGRGEGIVALVLKRLPDALRDNNTIRAVIRSTGVNYDGRTPSITQPNESSQLSLIRDTYEKAGISMLPTRYFEAHGTGTPVGDVIETSAIGSAFRAARSPNDPIGSVKSNIGHTEGASGLASVIKAILTLERGVIPPNANFELLNPNIAADKLNIKVPEQPTRWPTPGLRRASVNSFGASGTNAHVILDDAFNYLRQRNLVGNHCTRQDSSPHDSQPTHALRPNNRSASEESAELAALPCLIMLSASDSLALQRVLELHSQWMRENTADPDFLRDLAYTLLQRRSLLRYRTFAVIDKNDVLQAGGHFSPAICATNHQPRIAFIFTGQGAQWTGMGKDLFQFPVFHDSIMKCDGYLKELGIAWDVIDILRSTKQKFGLDHPVLSQTLCTVLQIALCDMYRALRVRPSVVVGHSSGEIAAAYCVGAISRKSAVRIAYTRGIQAAEASEKASGGMMAVAMGSSDIEPLLEKVARPQLSLTLAAINSPSSVTISGDTGQLEELAALLEERQVFHRRLRVDVAYHSPIMDTVSTAYKQAMGVLEPGIIKTDITVAPNVNMISSVTGKVVNAETLRQPEYWAQNLVRPVLFADAISGIWSPESVASGNEPAASRPTSTPVDLIMVEIGPHSALESPIREIAKLHPAAARSQYCSSMKRHVPTHRHLLATIGWLSCHGVKVDFDVANSIGTSPSSIEHGRPRRVVENLPEYPFDHSCTYLPTGRLGKSFRYRKHAKLDLLGKPVVGWNPLQPRWRNFLKLSELPWLEDHRINNTIIYPAVGVLVMAIEAAKQLADPKRPIRGFKLTDAYFMVALAVPAHGEGIETQMVLTPPPVGSAGHTPSWKFRLFSHDGTQWQEHSHGMVQIDYERDAVALEGQEDLEKLKDAQNTFSAVSETAIYRRTRDEFYDSAAKSGYTFGPSFKAMDDVAYSDCSGRRATASVKCFEWKEMDGKNHFQEHVVHPITLDGIIQLSIAAFTRGGEDVASTAVPAEIEYMWVSSNGLNSPQADTVKAVGTFLSRGNLGYETSVTALDSPLSRVTLEAKGIKLRFVTGDALAQDQAQHPHPCYSVSWKPDIDLVKGITHPSSTSTIDTQTQGARYNGSSAGAQTPLVRFLDLVTFKKPDMRILHMTGSNSDYETRENLQELFSSQQGSISHIFPCLEFAVSASTASKAIKTGMYDLVINSYRPGLKTLIEAHRILKPGGRLAQLLGHSLGSKLTKVDGHDRPTKGDKNSLRNSTSEEVHTLGGSEVSHAEYRRALEMAGLTKVLISTTGTTDAAILATASKPYDASALKSPMSYVIVIEETPFQEEMARVLGRALESTALKCTTCYLDQLSSTGEEDPQRTLIIVPELERALLQTLSPARFSRLRDALVSTKGLLWLAGLAENNLLPPDRALADGLTRVLRSENEEAVIVTAVLAHLPIPDQAAQILTLVNATDFGTTNQDYESSYLQTDDGLCIGRLTPLADISQTVFERSVPYQSKVLPFGEAPPLRLAIETPGCLDTLYFDEDGSAGESLSPGWVEIRVVAVGLNFKDLLLALGRENGTTFGIECAGVIHRTASNTPFKIGDRVCLVSPTAFSTFTRARAEHVARVPDQISLEHAAGVPAQFVTAWHAIHNTARAQKGESILIHSAAGGTGQAALQIAQLTGCDIFATVGSDEKKRFLIEHYRVAEDRIFYSRSTAFAQQILRLTNGRGVDVIINSLSGDGLLASWDIIAPQGRFIELGKKDIAANNSLPMRPFLRRATFTALETQAMAADHGGLVKEIIDQLMDKFAVGSLRPVENFQTLPISQIQKGMGILQSGQSTGKIVFEMAKDALVPARIRTQSSWRLDDTKTYVIAGGTGGIGLKIAEWMVKDKGARNLLLLSRSGLEKGGAGAAKAVSQLREQGAIVEAPQCDISDINALRRVIDKHRGSMPPIAGCIQSSMVLKDAVFANMSHEDWEAGTNPKTRGSWNLHTVLPEGLDFFVLLSSIAGIVGWPGQANYAAGNTYMDALAHYRNALGERAVSLDLGVMLDHGVLAANEALRDRILSTGLLRGVYSSELLALLDHYCEPASRLRDAAAQVAIGLTTASDLGTSSTPGHRAVLSLPFYSHAFAGAGRSKLANGEQGSAGNDDSPEAQQRRAFASAEAVTDAGVIVSRALLRRLVGMTPELRNRIPAEDEDKYLDEPLQNFGVDSLQAIGLRSWFAREFAADVPVFVIQGDQTLASLGLWVAGRSTLR